MRRNRTTPKCGNAFMRKAERRIAVKRLGAAVVAATTVGLAFIGGNAAPARAAAPVGDCPASFQLISLQDLAPLLGLTLEQVEAIPGIDTNGDLMTCFTQLPNGRFAGMDNHVPTP
jgi:hypothetical protein